MFWNYILIIAVAVAIFICWKEWKRTNRARLPLRLITSLLAVASIVLLSYPKKKEPPHSTRKIIVLTDGFNTDSLAYFLQPNKNIPAFSADYSLIQSLPNQKIKWIPDLSEFFIQHANDSVYVFGNGFPKQELDLLHSHSFIFTSPLLQPAINSIYWEKDLQTGAPFIVQGKYDNNSDKLVNLQLVAFGEVVDSAIIKQGKQTEFLLSTVPKHTGTAVYSLIALSGKDTLQNEALPVIVENKPPLKILMLSSAPDFEKTFLKNKLAQGGFEIVMNTVISKNKSDAQFLNTAKTSASQLSPKNLDNYDVLIADDQSLNQLPAFASSAIRSAIEDKGLGLIIKLSNDKNASSVYSKRFTPFTLKQDKKPFTLIHSSINDSNTYRLKIDDPVCIRLQNGMQSLLQDEQSNIYAANFINGQGRVIGTTLTNTYTLALTGNNKAWQSLWSLLLDKAAKKITPGETWHTGPLFSFANQSTPVIIETAGDAAPKGLINDDKISMAQNPLLPYQWHGTYWTRQRGWQTLVQQNGSIKNWFVYDQQDWKQSIAYGKIKATQQFLKDHASVFLPTTEGENNKLTSDTKIYLVILFFICCGFLWIEQKLA